MWCVHGSETGRQEVKDEITPKQTADTLLHVWHRLGEVKHLV